MKTTLSLLILSGMFLALPLVGGVQAAEKSPAYSHEQFKLCDKDKDNHLSKEEFLACRPGKGDVFQKMDTNSDGKLTTEEMRIGWPHLHPDTSEGDR